jgi:aminopeptidase N
MAALAALRISLLFFCLAALALPLAPAAAATDEPFFPSAGSRAYDVEDYRVRLSYLPGKDDEVRASVAMAAISQRRLGGYFSLDFVGPRVREVLVNGRAAEFERDRGKLRISPGEPIPKGRTFHTTISYSGAPPTVIDPDGTQEGWYRTDDGVIAVGEPLGTAAWIPCNNAPWDKAEFRFQITVPEELRAVANGRMGPVKRFDGRARYRWAETAPMSPYLAVLNIGRGRILKSRIGRLPSWTLIDPRLERGSLRPLAALPEVIRFHEQVLGAYPFDAAGSIVDYAPGLGYALETQSRPIYAYVPDLTTVVHETAHQWFGDSVGLERWPQIWLNEGFATWFQWYYAERHGGRSAAGIFRRLRRVPSSNEQFWNPPPGRPGSAAKLFHPSIYVRGAMTVQALREKIGTKPLLRLLRQWVTEHRHGSATIREFIDLAEAVSGRNLEPLFQRWLYQRGKPR